MEQDKGSGRISALRVAALAAIAALGTAATGAEPQLTLEVEGLRSAKGNVLVCLTASPKAFPDCSRDPAAVKRKIPTRAADRVDLGTVAPGSYAIALVHDENGNGKLDTRLMIPAEGFGFSNNPAIAFGPPKFRAARFDFDGGSHAETVRMKYML